MKQIVERHQERHFSAHNTFIHIAGLELDSAKESDVGQFNHLLISITFSALAIEAFANAVGDRIIRKWSDFNSMSPIAKIRFLAEHLNVSYDEAQEPWISLKILSKFRNGIAHPKPEFVEVKRVMSLEEYNSDFSYPESKLEKDVTIKFAEESLKAIRDMQKIICDQIPSDRTIGLYCDGWSGRAEIVPQKIRNG